MNKLLLITVGLMIASLGGCSQTQVERAPLGNQEAQHNAEKGSQRPNIFMIFSDNTPKRDFGVYGNPVVTTPRIDQLAQEGVRLNNMFTTSPTCAPSRASLYTGLYPIRNGAHPNWSAVTGHPIQTARGTVRHPYRPL